MSFFVPHSKTMNTLKWIRPRQPTLVQQGQRHSSVVFFCSQNWLQNSAQWIASLTGDIKVDFRDRHESILPSYRALTISDFTFWLLRSTSRYHVREVSQFICKWLVAMSFNYVITGKWRLDHKTVLGLCKIHTILEDISYKEKFS